MANDMILRNPREGIPMSDYSYIKWTAIICFFILFPPALILILMGLVAIAVSG